MKNNLRGRPEKWLVCLFFLVFTTLAHAAEVKTSLGPQFGYISGHTTYHISSYSGTSGVESELEFPLRAVLGGLVLTASDGQTDLEVGFLTNITSGSGKLKDSDWLTSDLDIQETGQAHPGKDIYSESRIDLRAVVLEGAVKTTYSLNGIDVLPTLGMVYQFFDFDAYDTEQVGYGPYASVYTVSVSGRTIEYSIGYFFFYLGPEVEGQWQQLTLSAGVFFCPYVYASDRDDHLLRYKLSEAETDGTGYVARLSVSWQPQRGPRVSLQGRYLSLNTSGTQRQTFYSGQFQGQTYTVDDTIKTDQWMTLMSILWKF